MRNLVSYTNEEYKLLFEKKVTMKIIASMQKGSCCKANSRLAIQEIFGLLWNSKFIAVLEKAHQ
jgi:hypothetical protein